MKTTLTTTGEEPIRQFALRSRVVGRPVSPEGQRRMVAMCPASGLGGTLVQRLVFHSLPVTGRWALRPVTGWPLPVTSDSWTAIETVIRSELRLPAGQVLWHLPPADQPQVKFGALLLDPDGRPGVFARFNLTAPVPPLTPKPARAGGSPVTWPVRLATLGVDGVSIEVSTPAPGGLHGPVHIGLGPLIDLCAEIQQALFVPPSADVPGHWVPMHGDLAYWNLRRYSGGHVLLLDWEDADWGPPHADLVRYLMTSPRGPQMVDHLPSALCSEMAESVDFWLARFRVDDGAPAWVEKKHQQQRSNLLRIAHDRVG